MDDVHRAETAGIPSPPRWQHLVAELSSILKESSDRCTRLEEASQQLERTNARNEQLVKRVKDLEREVQVWRQAHEQECIAKEAVVATTESLNRELTSMKEDSPLIICLIDGDSTIFDHEYIRNGQMGGRLAAQALHRGMLEYLAPSGTRAAVCATVYCNRTGLRDTLLRTGICSAHQFDSFWIGFVQAASMFFMVDVGRGKEAADTKLREALRIYSRMPQVMRIFFGGAHDGGYRPALASLALEQILDKVVLIQAHDEVAHDLRSLNLPTVKWDRLFLPDKLVVPGETISTPPSTNNTAPDSRPPTPGPSSDLPSGVRYIDPKVPLGQHVPPPCNFHYLVSNCLQGANCQYGHDYILKPAQLTTLRQLAKRSPCYITNRNQVCPHGDKCCMSHRCPNATNCPFIKAGKCRWTGRIMHISPTQ